MSLSLGDTDEIHNNVVTKKSPRRSRKFCFSSNAHIQTLDPPNKIQSKPPPSPRRSTRLIESGPICFGGGFRHAAGVANSFCLVCGRADGSAAKVPITCTGIREDFCEGSVRRAPLVEQRAPKNGTSCAPPGGQDEREIPGNCRRTANRERLQVGRFGASLTGQRG